MLPIASFIFFTSSIFAAEENNESLEVIKIHESKSFDQIIDQGRVEINNVLVVKIDVEGMEELVLRGSYNFLKLNTAPIILEYRRDLFLNYLEKDLSNIIEFLKNYEYSIYSLSENGELGNFDSTKKYENIIALKNDSPLNKTILNDNLLNF